ncbi:hypothetical protein TrVE_jg7310 [Triparma verrucosa]|uniref:cysteine desulfurase n=1 Tax=Triparma verrucosa TaxID=1606542 RepID=A0A9W7KXE0_9STRA|nr:hypothetical protein TrVE_jg7310 [Triparma verrucosa]
MGNKLGKGDLLYFDANGTTQVHPEVQKAICDALQHYGNPSTSSSLGKTSKALIASSTATILKNVFDTDAGNLIYTSCGTESNQLAIQLVLQSYQSSHPEGPIPHILTSTIEHPATINYLRHLESLNQITLTCVRPSSSGQVPLPTLLSSLKPTTILLTLIYAQNETGSIQPLSEISSLLKSTSPHLKIHADASQAVGKVSCTVSGGLSGVDLITITGHKFGSPKGISLLYTSTTYPPTSSGGYILKGGGQMNGLRSGTENVPYIVGLSKATEVCCNLEKEYNSIMVNFKNSLTSEIDKVVFNCNSDEEGLVNTLSIGFNDIPKKITSSYIISLCEKNGLIIAAGSACETGKGSYVLRECRVGDDIGRCTLRVSCGFWNTREEGRRAGRILGKVVKEIIEKG